MVKSLGEDMNKINIETFFLSISSASLMSLEQGHLEVAKQNIDLLELMQDKTKGNLTPEEQSLLEKLLFETRMKYLEKKNVKK